ncbi:hypothetical protein KSP40_PGU005061 [Platanthera guangdongensis]|uniref:Uncharacterized protein n=1 Tax=Platanthera guangdongensis TaxID=2320717 RepID=A0ABR2MJI9_9ASPA
MLPSTEPFVPFVIHPSVNFSDDLASSSCCLLPLFYLMVLSIIPMCFRSTSGSHHYRLTPAATSVDPLKELNDMAFQVKSELVTPNVTSLISTKSEKGSGKSRGSGSPFKCIGLGLAQQVNTEKDEELTSSRYKIEELEALAACRQKQIFSLNIRLAAAESMTHDVLRDLLCIKFEMTSYADKEWGKLKKQVDDFVVERQSLIEEINQRHKELIAAQIRLEKLQEQRNLLSVENELLKADNVKYKNIVLELEEELGKTLQPA